MQTFFYFILILGLLALAFSPESVLLAQSKANYDESNIPPLSLPNPLQTVAGKPVTTALEWENDRCPELLTLFATEMFGQIPSANVASLKFEELTSRTVLDGRAVRKEIRVFFNAPNLLPKADLLLYIPTERSGPVPAFLGLNFMGNHALAIEDDVLDPGYIIGSRLTRDEQAAVRGTKQDRWAIEAIIDRGYALATAYYEEIVPDSDDGFQSGVHQIFTAEYPDKQADDAPATITAWAWGLSRLLDCLETIPEINSKKVIVMGHSRLGKTALWAGANDKRFAAVISNNSGCGGAALSRRNFGETIPAINKNFPHWFCKKFKSYNDCFETIPFDQHELTATIAPRPVYIASAEEDRWADPKGEFLAGYYATPVYQLLGTDAMGDVTLNDWPLLDRSIGATIRYHIRRGEHTVNDFDWQQYLNFADKYVR